MTSANPSEQPSSCTWCGSRVDEGDGFRLRGEPAGRTAAFCRLEHIVPWAIQGAAWEPGRHRESVRTRRPAGTGEPDDLEQPDHCSHCGAPLGETSLRLVRHRRVAGRLHRIPDAFCSVDHLLQWAKAGGRWRS